MEGNRIFKSVSNSRIYHFGSVTTRKNKKIIRNEGKKTFLLKWKLTVEFFTKHYLRRGKIYDGPLVSPKINLVYLIDYIISKTKYVTYKFFKWKKKLTVEISEGLGNQIFMYAFAYALSKSFGYNLYLDNQSGYTRQKNLLRNHQKYMLDNFNI